jgi:hypothetical protein
MGDNFLESQAGNTKKRRAKAAEKRDTPKLIARPDVVVDEFRIDCKNGVVLKPGEHVICLPGRNGAPVDVVHEHRLLGNVAVGGGEVLRQEIEQNGVGRLQIVSYCMLTDTAKARLLKE